MLWGSICPALSDPDTNQYLYAIPGPRFSVCHLAYANLIKHNFVGVPWELNGYCGFHMTANQ